MAEYAGRHVKQVPRCTVCLRDMSLTMHRSGERFCSENCEDMALKQYWNNDGHKGEPPVSEGD